MPTAIVRSEIETLAPLEDTLLQLYSSVFGTGQELPSASLALL